MKVSTVFKALLAPIVIIVVLSAMIEYFNATTNSGFMKAVANKSIENACKFYVQESYKGTTATRYGNADSIFDVEGTEAVSGRFYVGTSVSDIYNSLYKTDQFKTFAKNHLNTWDNFNSMYYGLTGSVTGITGGLSEARKTMGTDMVKNLTTPLNIGVTYLDTATIEKIAKWNLVSTLSDGMPQNIVVRTGTSGLTSTDSYVKNRGFRVYHNTFKILSINYTVYDLTKSADLKTVANKIGVTNFNLKTSSSKLCIAEIKYSVESSYSGITPIQKILNYVNNYRVTGYKKRYTQNTHGVSPQDANNVDNLRSTISNNTGSSKLPIDDTIYYYVIK